MDIHTMFKQYLPIEICQIIDKWISILECMDKIRDCPESVYTIVNTFPAPIVNDLLWHSLEYIKPIRVYELLSRKELASYLSSKLIEYAIRKSTSVYSYMIIIDRRFESYITLELLLDVIDQCDGGYTLVLLCGSHTIRKYLNSELLEYIMYKIQNKYIHYLFYEDELVPYVTREHVRYAIIKSSSETKVMNGYSHNTSISILTCDNIREYVSRELIEIVINGCPSIIHHVIYHSNVYMHITQDLFELALARTSLLKPILSNVLAFPFLSVDQIRRLIDTCDEFQVHDVITERNIFTFVLDGGSHLLELALKRAHITYVYKIASCQYLSILMNESALYMAVSRLTDHTNIYRLLVQQHPCHVSERIFRLAIDKFIRPEYIFKLIEFKPAYVDNVYLKHTITRLANSTLITRLVILLSTKFNIHDDILEHVLKLCTVTDCAYILTHTSIYKSTMHSFNLILRLNDKNKSIEISNELMKRNGGEEQTSYDNHAAKRMKYN